MRSSGPDEDPDYDPEQDDDAPKPKSSLRRDTNHLLRQEQIQLYKSTVLKEDREERMKLRHSLGKAEESPKKKKRVSFHDHPVLLGETSPSKRSPTKCKDLRPEPQLCNQDSEHDTRPKQEVSPSVALQNETRRSKSQET